MGTSLSPFFFAAALGVLGAIIGSFTANLCLRWPRGESVVSGRSKCDSCGRTLGAGELLPILSFLAARGRCRSCRVPIDPLHWRVEIASAAIGFVAVFAFGDGVQAMAIAMLGWLLVPLAILDWRHFWLPNRLTLVVAATGLVLGGWASTEPLVNRLAAGAIGYLSLAAIASAYRHLRGVEGMGRGDPKLFGALGLWLGIAAMPIMLLLAALVGIIVAIVKRDARSGREPVAFGTMLCVTALPAMLIAHISII
jgi:leader peptidase (prepilin peptidase) / N-methyltransferase